MQNTAWRFCPDRRPFRKLSAGKPSPGRSTFNWTPDEIKKYDLALRYKTAAERAFQREYRLLEQHYKAHHPKPAKEPAAKEPAPEEPKDDEPDFEPPLIFAAEDPDSPTGYSVIEEYHNGRQIFNSRPCDPPGRSTSGQSIFEPA